jgi:sugar lactone lactonase YvrE
VADASNHRIRKITPQGLVSTLAGNGGQGHQDGEGTVAKFYMPFGVAVDGDGNGIVADARNHRIRKITLHGLVSTLAGTGEKGHQDGEGTVAQFDDLYGVAVDGDGNVIVADASNQRIRKITPQGHGVSTLAGTGEEGQQDGDELVASARFKWPCGVAVDEKGNVIVADTSNSCVRCVASDGVTPLMIVSLPPLPQSSFASDIQHHLFESGSFHDLCFVVEQERVPAHRALLSARCEYFRSMFGAGYQEGDSTEIPIEGTSSAAFKALLRYLYTDNMEVDDAVLYDLAKLSDQYRVERLHSHCTRQLFKGITAQNAIMRLVQAHTAGRGERPIWANKLKSTTMSYVTRNFEEIRCNAMPTIELLDREHPALFKQMLLIRTKLWPMEYVE